MYTQDDTQQHHLSVLRKRLLKLHDILCCIDELTLKKQEIEEAIKDEMKRAYDVRTPLCQQARELGLKDNTNLLIADGLIARIEGSVVHIESLMAIDDIEPIKESDEVEGEGEAV